ncbi:MAG TPA: polysaccharide pyruvyl transferase family protein [Acidimicrobiia bacterium]
MEVFVSAWVGSTNLGDELIFSALAGKLGRLGVKVTAASVSPASTALAHGVAAVPSSHPTQLLGAMMRADRLVLGGGGLLQDETSNVNLPYHMWRPVVARYLRTPIAGIGLGAGPLRTRGGRRWVQAGLRHVRALTVRDQPSADLLRSLGLEATVTADLAWSLPVPEARPPLDHFVVSLRPPVPASAWRTAAQGVRMPGEDWVAAAAGALDEISGRTGLPARFVAMQADRDQAVHELVAGRMSSPVSFSSPDLNGLINELGSGRIGIAMRYHAAIGTALAGRPVGLIGYSPKMEALASDLGDGAGLVANDPDGLRALPAAIERVSGADEAMSAATARLREREAGNDEAIHRLLERE